MEVDTRIPLIMFVPGMEPEVVGSIVDTIDIYPTLLSLAGLQIPGHVEKKDLFHKTIDYALSEIHWDSVMGYAVRTVDFRYIEWRNLKPPYQLLDAELYNHRSSQDERDNCLADSSMLPAIARLKKHLEID